MRDSLVDGIREVANDVPMLVSLADSEHGGGTTAAYMFAFAG